MKKVVVTGGTGFLGSWTCAQLIEAGYAVQVLDIHPKAQNLESVHAGLSARVEYINVDIRDRDAVAEAVRGFDAIVHLAGLMTVDCAANPVLGLEVNLRGSMNLIDAAMAEGIERLIYISTAGVYGPGDSRHPHPETEYGVLKLAVEGMARVAWNNHGLRSLGLRPYVIYGPGESAGIAAGPSIACRAAHEGRAAEIRFSGEAGFVHVTDVARAIVCALDNPLQGAELYDMAGEYSSVEAFVERLKHYRGEAEISISGPRLKLPCTLAGGDRIDWLDRLESTGIDAGIQRTLAHLEETSARI